MLPQLTLPRLTRLCLKELRESLRDRRTIVTLILMPLLVYPLLSLVLNRVLLTSMTASNQITVRIGIGGEARSSELPTMLMVGYALLHEPNAAPLFLTDVVPDRAAAGPLLESQDQPLPVPELLQLQDDGRAALRDASVDVVITRKSTDDGSDSENSAASPTPGSALQPLVEQMRRAGVMPGGLDPAAILESVGRYEIRFRQGDSQSERAVQLLERMLAAVNNEAARGMIGDEFRAPFRLVATPVAFKSNYADLLATMVPLVLVLMTMAGAVYPAIDLTAGERERGTMEALIVSPTPSAIILFAKYTAVVTVALLTALANLGAMTITLWVSGIGKLVFGEDALSLGVIGTVLVLLVLFTMFFAALLLAVTSFAKSFKEAQAYLIPLMLLALTPGVMSLLPGIKFTGLLATVPLVNIVLLAREILVGNGEWNTALVAVICNTIYAIAALAVASRLFGSDASMHGSQGSWRDLWLRPEQQQELPGVDQMALTMAVMFPLYFIASSTLPALSQDLRLSLWMSAFVSFVLILGVPLIACWYRNISIRPTFRLFLPRASAWGLYLPAVLLLGSSAWMFAHEIFVLGQQLGIGTIQLDQIERVAEFQERLKQLPWWTVIVALAVTPAICEEILFRGFVLSSLHRLSGKWAILLSALLFGLMHVLTANVLAIERFLPTTFMGLLLGWLALRTGSILPGMLLHAWHNGLLLSMGHFEDQLKQWNILVAEGEHLPLTWLAAGAVGMLVGCGLFAVRVSKQPAIPLPPGTPSARLQ